jgi:toxin ParE1/3/4
MRQLWLQVSPLVDQSGDHDPTFWEEVGVGLEHVKNSAWTSPSSRVRWPTRTWMPPRLLPHGTGEQAALGFIEALESAYAHISRYPATRSARYAHELELPGLRCWPLKRYPHLVFYVDRIDRVDVLRVLHGQIDIPAWMREPQEQRG